MKTHFSYWLWAPFFLSLSSCDKTPMDENKLDIPPEVTVRQIQAAFSKKTYSITDLTQFYLNRIKEVSENGPKLNAILTINPEALDIAKQLDKELENKKPRGPLHGIPILLKDNIDTKDKMPCTAGANPMKNSFPLKDSPLAAQLRDAGAVILGKANLSEWANFHSEYSSSGWSALGGQTKNPYDLTRNPCGSSAGSGVAVAANLCVIAIGTETNGSIVCPCNNNGIVGIKPTVGLVSRTGIIPISFTQDTGGPMARTVTDAAICLGALTTPDPSDSKTLAKDRVAHKDYTQFLKKDGLKGKRIGYYKSVLGTHVRLTKVMDAAVEAMRKQGATVIEVDEVLNAEAGGHSFQVLLYEFKDGLNKYFNSLGEQAVVKSLDDLIAQTYADETSMHYFDHALLKKANDKGDLTDKAYKEALSKALKMSREEGIDKVMNAHNLDAIVAPTGGPAWKTDLINGDRFGVFSSSPAAIAGYPSITVPMGNLDGMPVGISIFGHAWTEGKLLEIAFAYEQTTKHRMTPTYLSSD